MLTGSWNGPRGNEPCPRAPSFRTGSSGHGFTLLELLISIALIAILAGLLLPVALKARRQANSVHCRANLRQIGIALRVYADDHQGLLPSLPSASPDEQSQRALRDLLHGLPRQIFHCPEDTTPTEDPPHPSYDWNAPLNGQAIHRVGPGHAWRIRPRQAMVFDHQPWHGYKNAVYTDGQVGRLMEP